MFLEDILRTTGYTNKEMLKYKKEKQRGKLLLNKYKRKLLLTLTFWTAPLLYYGGTRTLESVSLLCIIV